MIVLALAFVLLATPFLGTVMAGKGQEKLYFKLYMEGAPDFLDPNYRHWESDDGETWQIRGMPWILNDGGDYEVTIGGAFPNDLDPSFYSCYQDFSFKFETWRAELKLACTIDFSGFFVGTIEIRAVGKAYNALTPFMYLEGTFVGCGTDDLEGVKVTGTFSSTPIDGGSSGLGITFEGTVKGWPD